MTRDNKNVERCERSEAILHNCEMQARPIGIRAITFPFPLLPVSSSSLSAKHEGNRMGSDDGFEGKEGRGCVREFDL